MSESKKSSNPLYVVSNNGVDVESANSLFDLFLNDISELLKSILLCSTGELKFLGIDISPISNNSFAILTECFDDLLPLLVK